MHEGLKLEGVYWGPDACEKGVWAVWVGVCIKHAAVAEHAAVCWCATACVVTVLYPSLGAGGRGGGELGRQTADEWGRVSSSIPSRRSVVWKPQCW